jgi:hypothetical protein
MFCLSPVQSSASHVRAKHPLTGPTPPLKHLADASPLRMWVFLVRVPVQWVVQDIFGNTAQFIFVTDHALLIVTLPDGDARCAHYAGNLAGGHRLEILDDGAQRIWLRTFRAM